MDQKTIRLYIKRYLLVGLLIVAFGVAAYAYRTDSQSPLMSAEEATLDGVSLTLEYATTVLAREKGLGWRTSLPEDYGMLFVFPEDDLQGFWMKDMLVPIDIFWLDAQGHVVFMETDVQPESYPDVFYPNAPARYVLETVSGFAASHGVTIGTSLLLKDFPTVSE